MVDPWAEDYEFKLKMDHTGALTKEPCPAGFSRITSHSSLARSFEVPSTASGSGFRVGFGVLVGINSKVA